MPNPTRQEILEAHEALEELKNVALSAADFCGDTEKFLMRKNEILKVLPPLPRLTMAEIEWDDDKHYLAEADHPGWGKVIMLGIGEEKLIDVFIPHLRKSNCIVPRGNLTPTGKRYTLTEVQE